MPCGCEDRRKDLVRAASALGKADWASFRRNLVNVKNSSREDAQRLARERLMNAAQTMRRSVGLNSD